MAFTPKTWVNGDVFTAAEANRLETGIDEAHMPENVGIIQVDSFDGANDTAKWNAAYTYAQQQTRIPWLQLPAREFNTGSTSFLYNSGTKVLAPGLTGPSRNLEVGGSAGPYVPGKWRTTCGTGASSLLKANGEVYNCHFAGLAFHGFNSQIFRSTTNSYACGMDNITFYGCQFGVGNPTEKWLGTQVRLTGHWTATGHTTNQMTIGGSDWDLAFYWNINSAAGSAGNANIIFDHLSKTTVWYIYMTNEGDAVGLRILGDLDRDVAIFGGIFEGRSQTNLATRPSLDIQGGTVSMYGPDFGQVSDTSSGTVNGVIHQSGGDLTIYHPTYRRGSAVAATFPLLYQTGGTASIHDARSTRGEQIRVRLSNGTTYTLPPVSNRINGLAPGAPFAVTGSRGGNAALASLLTQLAAAGIITDSTTA